MIITRGASRASEVNLAEALQDSAGSRGLNSNGLERGVVNFRAYADWDYWIAAGWENYLISHFDQGERRGKGGSVDHACGRGEGAGAAIGGIGEAV